MAHATCPSDLIGPRPHGWGDDPGHANSAPPGASHFDAEDVRVSKLPSGADCWVLDMHVFRDHRDRLWIAGSALPRAGKWDCGGSLVSNVHIQRTDAGWRVLEWPEGDWRGVTDQHTPRPYPYGDAWVVEIP